MAFYRCGNAADREDGSVTILKYVGDSKVYIDSVGIGGGFCDNGTWLTQSLNNETDETMYTVTNDKNGNLVIAKFNEDAVLWEISDFEIPYSAGSAGYKTWLPILVELNGKVHCLCNGSNSGEVTFNYHYVYDLQEKIWTRLPNTPFSVINEDYLAVKTGNGYQMILGSRKNNNRYMYDDENCTWTQLEDVVPPSSNLRFCHYSRKYVWKFNNKLHLQSTNADGKTGNTNSYSYNYNQNTFEQVKLFRKSMSEVIRTDGKLWRYINNNCYVYEYGSDGDKLLPAMPLTVNFDSIPSVNRFHRLLIKGEFYYYGKLTDNQSVIYKEITLQEEEGNA